MEYLAVGIVGIGLLASITALVIAVGSLRELQRLRSDLGAEITDVRRRLGILSRRVRAVESGEEGLPAELPAPGPPEREAEPSAGAAPEPSAEAAVPDAVLPSTAAEAAAKLPGALPKPPAPAPRRPRRTLEEMLGGSLLVWIGGVALALAGAFLVKYSFDQGWIGPSVRIAIGVAFGIVLIGAGELLRARSARVAEAACAAGIATLFAALLAGTNLYLLIPPLVGFAGMALTTAGAVVLSQRHGPFVAGLGLLGGFLTPALIREGEPRPVLLVSYLLVLQLGLLVITRRRGWWPLAIATVVGVHAWIGYWLLELPPAAHDPWLAFFILGSAAATVIVAGSADAREAWGSPGGTPVGLLLGWAGAVLGVGAMLALVHAGAFSNMEWGFLFLLCAGGLALGHLDRQYEYVPWFTAGASALLLIDWHLGDSELVIWRFAVITTAFAALHALGAWALGGRARVPERWATLSAASTIVYFLVAWAAISDQGTPVPWGLIALGLAALHAAALVPLLSRSDALSVAGSRIAAHAVAVTTLVSLAAAIELERAWIAVAWALEIAALAWLHDKLRVRALRWLAGGLGALVLQQLLLNPAVIDYPIGEMPILDWLLWGFGVPAAAFALAAILFRRSEDDAIVFGLEVGACALAAGWFALELRHLFHGSNLDSGDWTLAEFGLLSSGWLALGGGLAILGARWERLAVRVAGQAVAAFGLAVAAIGPCFGANPMWARVEVAGPRVFNTLLLAHGLPALLTAAWAVLLRLRGAERRSVVAAAASLALGFLFVTLEVRHWFHHPFLHRGDAGSLELYAYSTAWIVLGALLLAAGLRLGSRALRQAALLVMLLAVAKVFLYDMRELKDLYRVLSFFGLGVSLLGLGHIYQRFVLREPGRAETD